jgi:hypothetical protein
MKMIINENDIENYYQLLIVKKITKIYENEGTKNVPLLKKR